MRNKPRHRDMVITADGITFPSEFTDAQRRGFHDGIEGARKDYENHRAPNVNNRDEYRHPNVPRELRHDYRVGFEHGYDAGVRHMMGGDRDHDDREHDDRDRWMQLPMSRADSKADVSPFST